MHEPSFILYCFEPNRYYETEKNCYITSRENERLKNSPVSVWVSVSVSICHQTQVLW